VGVCGVFELLRDLTQSAVGHLLCRRALVSLLNILQAQTPEALRDEPADIVGTCQFSPTLSLEISWHLRLQNAYSFSALTLFVGRQEEHPACKN